MTRFTDALRRLSAGYAAGTLAFKPLGHELCALLAEQLECSRVSLWRFRGTTKRSLHRLAVHEAPDAAAFPLPPTMPAEVVEHFALLPAGTDLASDDCFADPRLAALMDPYLRPFSVHALLDVAFSVNGRSFGVLCCEQTDRPRAWRPQHLAALRRASCTLSLALARPAGDSDWDTLASSPMSLPPWDERDTQAAGLG